MNFSQRQADPRRHLVGFTFVILLHVFIVYALVTGLAKKVVDVVRAPIETKVIEEIKKPPPPPEIVLPPPPKLEAPPPPFIPPPEVQIATPPVQQPTISVTTSTPPPAPVTIAPTPPVAAAPAPPRPATMSIGVACTRQVQPSMPVKAIREGITGTVKAENGQPMAAGTYGSDQAAMYTNTGLQLQKALARFNELAPRVQIHLEIASPQDLLQRLLDGRYSLILTPIDDAHPSLNAVRLFDEQQSLYCGAQHELFNISDGELTLDQLQQFPYAARTYMKENAGPTNLSFQSSALTSHMESLAILILSGRYIGYLPTHFAAPFAERGETILIARAGKTVARLTPDKAVPARVPKRFGFMLGELKIPDDFDTMFQDEIGAMFEGMN